MRCMLLLLAATGVLVSATATAQERPGFRYVGADTGPSRQPALPPGAASAPAVQPVAGWNSPGCDSPPCTAPICEQKVCRLHTSMQKIKKTCFEVKCEAVCVPPVTFPWEKSPCEPGCAPGCAAGDGGRVIYVTVPLIREYECGEECVCAWKLEDACLGSPPERAPADDILDAVPAAPDEAHSQPRRPSLAIRPPAQRRSAFGWLRLGSRN